MNLPCQGRTRASNCVFGKFGARAPGRNCCYTKLPVQTLSHVSLDASHNRNERHGRPSADQLLNGPHKKSLIIVQKNHCLYFFFLEK